MFGRHFIRLARAKHAPLFSLIVSFVRRCEMHLKCARTGRANCDMLLYHFYEASTGVLHSSASFGFVSYGTVFMRVFLSYHFVLIWVAGKLGSGYGHCCIRWD